MARVRVDRDKSLGALLGLAVGDALGAPLEGMTRQEIEREHGRVSEMMGGGRHEVGPGQGTGDTGMALALAKSLVSTSGYDPDQALDAYVEWFQSDPPGVSDSMRQVLGAVAGGTASFAATQAAPGADSAGNGALMRAAPIGIAFAGNDQAIRDVALSDAALTHFDPLAGKTAMLHGHVVSWSITAGPQRVFDELKDSSELDDRIEDVVYPATGQLAGPAETLAGEQPGSALAALAVGLTAYFNADSFEDGLVWVVNLGGDADTNGAVAGALLGARLGASAIPERWLSALQRRDEVQAVHEQLVALAG